MDNAELRTFLEHPRWRSLTIELDGPSLKRLLDDSEELARLKAMPVDEVVEKVKVYEFLRDLLADLETQRDISLDWIKDRKADHSPAEIQHWGTCVQVYARIAERIRYFLETPAKGEEK